MASAGLVSILTQPEGWVPYESVMALAIRASVSILTQPEGWVPCHQQLEIGFAQAFQSSPNPKVGCHQVKTKIAKRGHAVSILTQPEGWVPYTCRPAHMISRHGKVSILTQPEGWVPCSIEATANIRYDHRFNPHPTRRLGAMLTSQAVDLLGVFLLFSRSPLNRTGNPPRRASRKQENR